MYQSCLKTSGIQNKMPTLESQSSEILSYIWIVHPTVHTKNPFAKLSWEWDFKHYLSNSFTLSFRIFHNIQNIFPITVNNLCQNLCFTYEWYILYRTFTRCSKCFSANLICLKHTSSLRVKIIFINLLWKKFEI